MWRSAGSTQVTIDQGFVGGNLTGEFVRTLYVGLKYVDYTYCDPEFGVCEETVYAADTPPIPVGMSTLMRLGAGAYPHRLMPYTCCPAACASYRSSAGTIGNSSRT